MAKEYHNLQPNTIIYHNNNQCEEGKKIEKENLKPGKGSKIKDGFYFLRRNSAPAR